MVTNRNEVFTFWFWVSFSLFNWSKYKIYLFYFKLLYQFYIDCKNTLDQSMQKIYFLMNFGFCYFEVKASFLTHLY